MGAVQYNKESKRSKIIMHRIYKTEKIIKNRLDKTRLFVRDGVCNDKYGLISRQLQVIQELKQYIRDNRNKQFRFPDFMVIGTPRAASTWTKKVLAENEKVLFSVDEPRYFSKFFLSDAECYLNRIEPHQNNFLNFNARNLEDVVQGEKNPDYMCLPEKQVYFIKKLMPELKIILLVRDPIDAAWSNLQFEFPRKGLKLLAVEKEDVLKVCRKWKLLWSYHSAIPVWSKYFKDFLIIHYEDISTNPIATAVNMSNFIGAPKDDFQESQFIKRKVNEASQKVEITPFYFDYLMELFRDEYENWESLFGRVPKYQPK